MPGGRPSRYTKELADDINRRLAESTAGLESVLDELRLERDETPTLSTVYRWFEQYPEFRESSARAMQLRADTLVDRAVVESLTSRIGEITTERYDKDGNPQTERKIADNVERSKLVVQTLLRRAGQLAPKKYAERQILAGDDENPLTIKSILVPERIATKPSAEPKPEFGE